MSTINGRSVGARSMQARAFNFMGLLPLLLAPTALTSMSCLSKPGGESLGTVKQALDAGEFVVLNELKMNAPGGADNPWQYIELLGTPGAVLTGYQVVAVDGTNGSAVMVVDLATACGGPCAIGSNGILMIKADDSDAGPVGHMPPAEATVVKDAQLLTSSIPNGNTAVLLISGPAPITEGSSLAGDAGDAGGAVIPDGDTVTDSVGWVLGGAYAGFALVQAAGNPDAASRLPGHLETGLSAWYNADILGGAADGLAYDGARASANFPPGGTLTPGAQNFLSAPTDGGPLDSAGDAVVTTDGPAVSIDVGVGEASAPVDSGARSDGAAGGAAGTGGSPGSGGSAGTGGAISRGGGGSAQAGAGGSATAGAGGTSTAGSAGTPPASDSGCSCRTAGSSSSSSRGGVLLALLGLGAYSRRRRKHRI